MKNFTSLILRTHLTFKIIIVCILMLMPFFFVSVYLFNYELIEKINTPFYSDIHFWFVLCLCFCLSLLWFYVNLVLSIICFVFLESVLQNEDYQYPEIRKDVFISNMADSIFSISLALYVNFLVGLSFTGFILLALCIGLSRLAFVKFIIWIIKKTQ